MVVAQQTERVHFVGAALQTNLGRHIKHKCIRPYEYKSFLVITSGVKVHELESGLPFILTTTFEVPGLDWICFRDPNPNSNLQFISELLSPRPHLLNPTFANPLNDDPDAASVESPNHDNTISRLHSGKRKEKRRST